jgi:hypothetical protein
MLAAAFALASFWLRLPALPDVAAVQNYLIAVGQALRDAE